MSGAATKQLRFHGCAIVMAEGSGVRLMKDGV